MRKIKIPSIVPDYQNKDRIILRDFLALERTTLANERTLFAYIRTSLYLILGGIAFLKLESFENNKWLGYLSFAISLLMIVYGVLRYNKLKTKLKKFYNQTDMEKFDNQISDKESNKKE